MSYTPTAEQVAVAEAFTTGDHLVVEAGAGAGKTSTLKLCAGSAPRRRGLYIAYNKAISMDAERSFPASVLCRTAHSLAYGAVGRRYAARLRGPRQTAAHQALIMGIGERLVLGSDVAPLAPQQVARIVMATLGRFCHSADAAIVRRHLPLLAGATAPVMRALAEAVVPIAQRTWDEQIVPASGSIRFTHDMYLKLWALGRPQLGADYVLLDEAQDANPVIAALVDSQDAQRILVGDQAQAIYGWRGAVDAMRTFQGRRLRLSQSFRFGPAIADEANKWLHILGVDMRLRGFDAINSRVGPCDRPDAILCRTNAGAVARITAGVGAGRRVAIVGGGDDLRRLAEAARDLKAGRGTTHPELATFARWSDVQDYAEHDTSGSDLSVGVKLIDKYGPDGVLRILNALVPEDRADLVLSTAHKAKGREWGSVQVAGDFREPKDGPDGSRGEIDRDEAMLAYVTVTRAQRHLDRAGLAWVDRWVAASPPTAGHHDDADLNEVRAA